MTDTIPDDVYERAAPGPDNGRPHRTPAHAPDLELDVAHLALEYPDTRADLLEAGLHGELFHNATARDIVHAILQAHQAGDDVDRHTVRARLPAHITDVHLAQVVGRAISTTRRGPDWVTELARLADERTIDDTLQRAQAARADGVPAPLVREMLANAADGSGPASPSSRLHTELDKRAMTGDDIATMQPAQVIVPELGIVEASTVELFGRMKSMKTFLLTDLGCSLAAGIPWRGHDIGLRRVLYLIGEGTQGLGARIRAWKYYHQVDTLGDSIFQPTRLSLHREDDYRALLDWVKLRGPFGLVVLDTLARYSAGVDENSSQMQLIVERAEHIRDAASPNAPLIIAHHSGRSGNDNGRGHTSVEAACDLILRTERDDDIVTAEVLENRHGPAGHRITSRIVPVPEAREGGEDWDPVVLVPHVPHAGTTAPLPENRRLLLEALQAITIADEWHASGTWEAASDLAGRTFHRAKKDLVDLGHVEMDGSSRHPRYRLNHTTSDTNPDQDF